MFAFIRLLLVLFAQQVIDGLFGVILSVLGIMAACVGIADGSVLLWGGIIVLLMGLGLAVYYLSFGVFYDGETFLLSRFGKKDVTYRFDQIKGQKLYLVQGGNIIIELQMTDGGTVSLCWRFMQTT